MPKIEAQCPECKEQSEFLRVGPFRCTCVKCGACVMNKEVGADDA